MTTIVYEGGCDALLIGDSYRPNIRVSAEWLRDVRESYTADPILWALVCHARAWGTLPTVCALGLASTAWALRD